MPHLPEWIVDSMENLMSSKFIDAAVVKIAHLNEELVKITFKANLQKVDYFPGWAFMCRVGAKDLRHYTPSFIDKENGLFDIIFHLHGNGPGSDLAATIQSGDSIKMGLPAGKNLYVPERKHHFFFGDETSISFVNILVDHILRDQGNYQGILELNPQNLDIKDSLAFKSEMVARTPENPASNVLRQFRKIIDTTDFPLDETIFCLTGNVASVQAFRKELKKMGVNSKNIKLQGYWAESSVGL